MTKKESASNELKNAMEILSKAQEKVLSSEERERLTIVTGKQVKF